MAGPTTRSSKSPSAMSHTSGRNSNASQARRRSSAMSGRGRLPSVSGFGDPHSFNDWVASQNFEQEPNGSLAFNEGFSGDQPFGDFYSGALANDPGFQFDLGLDNPYGTIDDLNLNDYINDANGGGRDVPRNSRFALPSDPSCYPLPQEQTPQAYYPRRPGSDAQAQNHAAFHPYASTDQFNDIDPALLVDNLDPLGMTPTVPIANYEQFELLANSPENSKQLFKKQSPKRTFSQSSGDSEPLAKKLRSNSLATHNPSISTNSHYSAHSRGSSGTDHSTRRHLKETRKFAQARNSAVKVFEPEKPKVREDKPWIRINATTQGLTSRTGKINNYEPKYEACEHPVGNWVSKNNHHFKYNPDGALVEATYPARYIKDFIYNYPKNNKNGTRLKLWIQKCPTDSANRYSNLQHSKCLFKECPARIYQTGTILHGHIRVAFDEKYFKYGLNADPYLTAGYAHLYCMERFLDFADVCRIADVEVDCRQMNNEPKQKFAGTLANQPEGAIAEDFIRCAAQGDVRDLAEFENYPFHPRYHGRPKPYDDTLNFHMNWIKAQTRPQAQLRQFQERGPKPSHLIENMGDLEILFEDVITRKQKARKVKAKNKKRKKAVENEDDDQDSQDEQPKKTRYIDALIERAGGIKPRKKQTKPTSSAPPPKRRWDEYDGEDDDDEEEDQQDVPEDFGSETELSDDEVTFKETPSKGSRPPSRQLAAQPKKNYSGSREKEDDMFRKPTRPAKRQTTASEVPTAPRTRSHDRSKASANASERTAATQNRPSIHRKMSKYVDPKTGDPVGIYVASSIGIEPSERDIVEDSHTYDWKAGLPELPPMTEADAAALLEYNATGQPFSLEWLDRRRSSQISQRLRQPSRTLSILKSALSSPSRRASGNRVSLGGASVHHFDTTAAPARELRSRNNSIFDSLNEERLASPKHRTPSGGVQKPKGKAKTRKY